MAGNVICKLRKNVMKKNIYLVLLLPFIFACTVDNEQNISSFEEEKKYEWRLVTAWPKNYPGLGMAPERIANLVEEMSDGQMKLTVD